MIIEIVSWFYNCNHLHLFLCLRYIHSCFQVSAARTTQVVKRKYFLWVTTVLNLLGTMVTLGRISLTGGVR